MVKDCAKNCCFCTSLGKTEAIGSENIKGVTTRAPNEAQCDKVDNYRHDIFQGGCKACPKA